MRMSARTVNSFVKIFIQLNEKAVSHGVRGLQPGEVIGVRTQFLRGQHAQLRDHIRQFRQQRAHRSGRCQPVMFHQHRLRAAQNVPSGNQPDDDLADLHRLAIGQRLDRAGRILPVAFLQDSQGRRGRQDATVPSPRVVAVAMRQHGLVDRPVRIDVKAPRFAPEARRANLEPGLRTQRMTRHG